jgi:L-iditol 2-dehydrogenase
MPTGQMRQVVVRAPGQIEILSTAIPTPRRGEVLVRTTVVGICGTDLHAVQGKHPFIDLPYIPGHEATGVIDEVGPDVTEFTPGDRVLVEPNLVCGECQYCRSGRYNLCDRLVVLGCQTPGAMADAFTVPASRLHPIPDTLTDSQAALVEPLSSATHAVRIAGDLTGSKVAILGGGSIGLLTLVAARAAGADAVIVTDLQADKLKRAVRLGAVAGLDPHQPDVVDRIKEMLGGRPDCTFDCVSNQSSIDQAIALAHKGGTVIVLGVAMGPVTIPLSIVQDREIRIEGSAMYVRQDVQRAIELMAGNTVPVDEFITSRFPLERVLDAFVAARAGDQVKVHIHVNGAKKP